MKPFFYKLLIRNVQPNLANIFCIKQKFLIYGQIVERFLEQVSKADLAKFNIFRKGFKSFNFWNILQHWPLLFFLDTCLFQIDILHRLNKDERVVDSQPNE